LILALCDKSYIVQIMLIIKTIFKLACYITPIIVIIISIIHIFKVVTNGKEEDLKDAFKVSIKRIIAGLVICFLPALINYVFTGIVNAKDVEFLACFESASKEKVKELKTKEEAKEKAEQKQQEVEDEKLLREVYEADQKRRNKNKQTFEEWKKEREENQNNEVNVNTTPAKTTAEQQKVLESTQKSTKNAEGTKVNSSKNAFSSNTQQIINEHMFDFNVDNYDKVIQSFGGYENYLKSLGGVFTKYAGVENAHVTTKQQFKEVGEYVWGIMTMYGFEYRNYKVCNNCEADKWRSDEGGTNDAFYPGTRGCCLNENPTKITIDDVASKRKGNGMTTNCTLGVEWILRKSGLMKVSDPYAWNEYMSKGQVITDASKLQPGDIMFYWNTDKNINSIRSWSNDTWWSGMFHINIVGERNDSNGTITYYDSGHYYTQGGNYKYVRNIGQYPYEWAADWVGVRLFELK